MMPWIKINIIKELLIQKFILKLNTFANCIATLKRGYFKFLNFSFENFQIRKLKHLKKLNHKNRNGLLTPSKIFELN